MRITLFTYTDVERNGIEIAASPVQTRKSPTPRRRITSKRRMRQLEGRLALFNAYIKSLSSKVDRLAGTIQEGDQFKLTANVHMLGELKQKRRAMAHRLYKLCGRSIRK